MATRTKTIRLGERVVRLTSTRKGAWFVTATPSVTFTRDHRGQWLGPTDHSGHVLVGDNLRQVLVRTRRAVGQALVRAFAALTTTEQ